MWVLRCLSVLTLALPFLAVSCRREHASAQSSRGKEVYTRCVACHGPDGSGSKALGAPAIAGVDAWYVAAQLYKFNHGIRGSHPGDAEGSRMQSIARDLSEADIPAVAKHVAQMPPAPGQAVVEGDPARGRSLWERCTACHGPMASGSRAVGAPPLDRTNDWYLLAQLGKFRRGVRGTHPSDTTGAMMRVPALALPDDQATRDVVAYIASLR
jgi:cytochrome c oxidase subunit 2